MIKIWIRKNIQWIVIILLAVVMLSFVIINRVNKPKIAYIECIKVFNDFTMKKELEAELHKIISLRQSGMDSMQKEIELLKFNLENSKTAVDKTKAIKERISMLQLKRKEIDEVNYRLAQEYDDKIWKQLNQYVQDYSEKKGYDYILGAKGDASMMAANKKFNLTVEITEYVNKRYQGDE